VRESYEYEISILCYEKLFVIQSRKNEHDGFCSLLPVSIELVNFVDAYVWLKDGNK
jgi:hypothetical protein